MKNFLKKICVGILLSFAFLISPTLRADPLPSWSSEVLRLIRNGGVYVEGADGKPLLDYQGNKTFMPASTLKLVTGLSALEILGKDYRFKTEFYWDANANLYVKGFGDPYLVSEELNKIALALKSKGLKQIHQIILDASYFEEIKVPGISASLNPYDALNSALSANFNTIYIQRNGNRITSAEDQTPMTELTQILASKAPSGKSRINLAAYPEQSLLYVGHLLKAFLGQQGIAVDGAIRKGHVNGSGALLLYQHKSSKTLDQVVQPMMKFSTNFIANQLFLIMGAEKLGAPANLSKGKRVVEAFLKAKLGIHDFNIEEGSGISRENRISPINLVKVLRAFEKYKQLLPEKLENVLAKTGTIHGVSALAGYFNSNQHQEIRFSILLNQSEGNREKIARVLYEHLH